MLCAFKALQLQRTESRMFWNAAGLLIRASGGGRLRQLSAVDRI